MASSSKQPARKSLAASRFRMPIRMSPAWMYSVRSGFGKLRFRSMAPCAPVLGAMKSATVGCIVLYVLEGIYGPRTPSTPILGWITIYI